MVERLRGPLQRQEATIRNAARPRDSFHEDCDRRARRKYEESWAAACKGLTGIQAENLKKCLAEPSIASSPYMGERWCHERYMRATAGSNCALPSTRADAIDQTYVDEQRDCRAGSTHF